MSRWCITPRCSSAAPGYTSKSEDISVQASTSSVENIKSLFPELQLPLILCEPEKDDIWWGILSSLSAQHFSGYQTSFSAKKKKKKSYIIAFHLFRTYIFTLLQLLVLKRSGRAEEKQTKWNWVLRFWENNYSVKTMILLLLTSFYS